MHLGAATAHKIKQQPLFARLDVDAWWDQLCSTKGRWLLDLVENNKKIIKEKSIANMNTSKNCCGVFSSVVKDPNTLWEIPRKESTKKDTCMLHLPFCKTSLPESSSAERYSLRNVRTCEARRMETCKYCTHTRSDEHTGKKIEKEGFTINKLMTGQLGCRTLYTPKSNITQCQWVALRHTSPRLKQKGKFYSYFVKPSNWTVLAFAPASAKQSSSKIIFFAYSWRVH